MNSLKISTSTCNKSQALLFALEALNFSMKEVMAPDRVFSPHSKNQI
jgi:hypothetical protein